jgi:hypothetical protein
MRFKIGRPLLAVLVSAMLSSACTEKLPLTPIYTGDADWTPTISLFQNGYQRVAVLIDPPSHKELWRNISFLTLQARKSPALNFDEIDTLRGIWAAPWGSGQVHPILFQSKPRLEFATDYGLRVTVHFGTGEISFSDELAVRTPPSIGKILKRVRSNEGEFNPGNLFLSFHRGSLMVLRYSEILRIDTGSGQTISVKKDFHPPYDKGQYSLIGLAVIGDTAYSFYPGDDYSKKRLISLNLNTLHVDSNVTIVTPGKGLATTVAHRGELYGFWWTTSGTQQAGIINPQTGEVVQWFPETSSSLGISSDIASDGINIFYGRSVDFESRITAINPVTMSKVREDRNPVFSSTCLAWDGANFWVIDYETQTFAKLTLEGM